MKDNEKCYVYAEYGHGAFIWDYYTKTMVVSAFINALELFINT